jgi:hypothetical protein
VFRASCIVMVEAPWAFPPDFTFVTIARSTPIGSTPWWS